MSARIRRLLSGWLILLVLSMPGGAGAVVITYQATDLLDPGVGEDLWQYRYSVSGGFVQFGGFNVLFSPALYRDLQNLQTPLSNDWLIAITDQPDPALPKDGILTAVTQVANLSLAEIFTLDFIWLGAGSPGSQPFEVYDETFLGLLETGQTRVALPPNGQVPLPGTLALLGLGLFALGARTLVRRRISPLTHSVS